MRCTPATAEFYIQRKLAAWQFGTSSREYRETEHWRNETWRLYREAYKARREGASYKAVQEVAYRACLASENWAYALDRYAQWDQLAREIKEDGENRVIRSAVGFAMMAMRSIPEDLRVPSSPYRFLA